MWDNVLFTNDPDEPQIYAFTKRIKTLFDNFIKVGFDDDQAMDLVMHILALSETVE